MNNVHKKEESITIAIKPTEVRQEDIAKMFGFSTHEMLAMSELSHTFLPLEKLKPLAVVLGMDPMYLLKLVLLEYYPGTLAALHTVLNGLQLNEEEMLVLNAFRRLRNDDTTRKLVAVVMQ